MTDSHSYGVVGAIGTLSTVLQDRITATNPELTIRETGSADAFILSQHPLTPWHGTSSRGFVWDAINPSAKVADWKDAMHAACAPGLAITDDGIILHASEWAVQPVYIHRQGDVLLFATTINAILRLVDGKLDPDWDAWAAILAVKCPLGGRTPFASIARLGASISHVVDTRTRRFSSARESPRTIGENREPASAAEIAETIKLALVSDPDLDPSSPQEGGYLASLPLTGGWDSRMIAGTACNLFGPGAFSALTTPKHTEGDDPDVTASTQVATFLGITQTVTFPDSSTFSTYASRAFELVEYETWEHLWFEPAVAHLHQRKLPVLDGLAGDALFKNDIVSEDLLAARTTAEVGDRLWGILNKLPKSAAPGLPDHLRDELVARARVDMEVSRSGLEGMRDEGRHAMLRTRTCHGIALAPYKMIASHTRAITPHLHPDVANAILSVPWQQKSNSALARAVLEEIRPGLSKLPSTNDRPRTLPTTGSMRWDSPNSMDWTRERMSRLNELAHVGLSADDATALHAKRFERWRNGLIVLACWLETYESRLTSTRPPWW
ncbi:MAG: hypothetical protein ABIR57_07820 [Aeromicrobium sp.]